MTTTIQRELQTRLEIIINANTSYSNSFKFEFRPFMINANTRNSDSDRYGYGSTSGYMSGNKGGIKTTMVFLPISHLVESIFPLFKKRYRKQGMLTFTNSEEYLQYVKFANGLLYEEEEEKKLNGANPKSESKYTLDDENYTGMINRNIKFILNELFTKNRILINVFDNNGNNNNNYNNSTSIGNGINQEYFIETFMMPMPMPITNEADSNTKPKSNTAVPIFKISAEEIGKLTEDKNKINSEISELQKKMQTSDDNNKIEFQIAQKKLRREKIIQQIFTYTYGEMDSKLKEALINAEKYRNEIATLKKAETNEETDYTRSLSSSALYFHKHNQNDLIYKQQSLKKTNTWLELRKVRIYIVTINEMSLVPSLLDNGKDNPQFIALRNKMVEGDFFDGRIKSESIFQLPTRAQCASDKRIIERMFDEIFNAKRLLGKNERDETRTYVPSNYLEDFKKLFEGIGSNKSSEYFDKTTFKYLTPTYEGRRKVAGGDEDPIVILCRTKMGAFLLFFTLLETETLKLHRPNISSLDKVHIRELPMNPEMAGGGRDTFEVALPIDVNVKNLDLILNTNVPPAYFTSNADYGAYNAYKTHDSVYKRFDFFVFRLDSPIDVKNYEAAVKMVGSLIKSVRAEIETYKSLPAPEKQFEFAVKLESMSSLVRAIKHLTNNGPTTDKRHFAITALRIAERIEEKEKELSKWLLQKKEYDDARSKIIAKYKPTNAVAFNKHMKDEFVLDDDYKTKPFDDSYYEARAAIDQTFFDSMNIPVNALTQIAVSIPESDAMIVKIKAARDYANRIRGTTSKIVYAFAHTTAEKIDDKSTELLHDVNDLSTKAKNEIIGAATALNLRAQNLFDEIGNALTNLLSIRGIVYGIPLILANSAEMAILAAGGVVTVAAGAGTLAISIASAMAVVAATSASYSAILGLIAAYEVAEKSLIAVGGIILTSGAIAALSVTLMIDAFNIVGRTFKKIKDWLSNKIIEIKNWWRNRDLVKIIENGQKIIPRLGDIEAFNAELIGDKVVDDVVVANHKRDAMDAMAEHIKLLTSGKDVATIGEAYKKRLGADMLVEADEANARKISYVFKQIETALGKITPTTPTTPVVATSKKSESKFDDVAMLKGIIEDVGESAVEDENDETPDVKKMKIPVPAPAKPIIKKEVGKVAEKAEKVVGKELTSDEQGKKLAAKMKQRGVIIETGSSRGLRNQGQTCYMNAALQLIFSMTKVKDAIIATTTGYSDTSTFNYLKQYMEKMNGGNDIQPANELFDSVKGAKHFQGRSFGNQEDSEELLIRIFDTIKSDSADIIKKIVDPLKFKKIDLTVANGIELSVINKCREHHINSNPVQKSLYETLNNKNILFGIPETTDSTTIRMNISKSDSTIKFKDIYDAYISERAIYGKSVNMDNEITYPYCRYNSSSAAYPECKSIFNVEPMTAEEVIHEPLYSHKFKNVKTQDIIQFNKDQKYFIVQLMRFGDTKITTSIDIENSEIPANDGTTDVFRILGCICHSGSLDGGHYTYASFKDGKPDKYYNDGAVSDLNKDTSTKENLKTWCYILLFERVTKVKAKAGGGSNQANVANQAKETRRCQLAAANRPSPNKYTRRHNKNKDRVVPTVTVIKH